MTQKMKKNPCKLSILVVSRTPENITRLLKAIDESEVAGSYEVICSWNGEGDSADLITVPSGVHFSLHVQRPYNFAKNNNYIADRAQGDILLFINDDLVPDRGAINKALAAVEQPTVGMVGINLRYADGRLQHAGVFFRTDGTPYHRFKHQISWDSPDVSQDMFVPAITGAFVMMRRNEFLQFRFDEAFRVCGEDIALSLTYRTLFPREILYVAAATAVHYENVTRKKFGETKTPEEDMARIVSYSTKIINGAKIVDVRRPRVRIITEKPGWIMHRKAEEIAKYMGTVKINEDYPEADIHYYINYGYYNKRPATGLVVANFTHFDPDHLADKFVAVAHEVDHCVAVSEQTAKVLIEAGVPRSKISVIMVGADRQFKPKLTVGIVGRVYPGGRKGEDIVAALLSDKELTARVNIVASKEGWHAPVWSFPDVGDFYRAIDFLLVPSRLEGGPVPFMEALACGTMSIAPEIGVVPEFPHVSYPVGDVAALKGVLMELAEEHEGHRGFLTAKMKGLDWEGWAMNHDRLFRTLAFDASVSSNKQ
ncbi:glycosyltransferase (plasmid) [Sinorhizobium chiapasense]|uniref:glycosyltransferase n=1 Tax=Sinorhizobium chiapasense TaxID=501572 RepID=UPI002FE0ED99